jgi:hypothetical protein
MMHYGEVSKCFDANITLHVIYGFDDCRYGAVSGNFSRTKNHHEMKGPDPNA